MFLMQRMFFGPLDDLVENADVLDLQCQNPSRFVRAFQRCVDEKEVQLLTQQQQ